MKEREKEFWVKKNEKLQEKKSWHPEKFTILYSLFTTIWLKLLQTDTEISLWVWGQKNRKKTKKQLKIITKNQNKAHDRVMTLALFIFFYSLQTQST